MFSGRNFDEPHLYVIKIQGELDREWSEWFGKIAIHCSENETQLLGWITDQAHLFGILNKIRDLGLPLLLVQYLNDESKTPLNLEGG